MGSSEGAQIVSNENRKKSDTYISGKERKRKAIVSAVVLA
jgi:hypothetical protein